MVIGGLAFRVTAMFFPFGQDDAVLVQLLDQFLQIHLGKICFGQPLLRLGQRQQVVDNGGETEDFLQRAFQHAAVFFGRLRVAEGEFDFTAHDGERCAKFM